MSMTAPIDATASPTLPSQHKALLKLQIGPVQEFIAQARSTRDLWSGSYLLSWLVAAGIRRLLSHEVKLVFPNAVGQPLLRDPESWRSLEDHTTLLTPNFTNIFVAIIPAEIDAKIVATDVQQVITDEWSAICSAVWRSQDFIEARQKDRFERQVKRFLTISWQITPLTEAGYAAAYQQNGWQLDAVRQTRDFKAWCTGATDTGVGFNKDSLSGKEEAVAGGPEFTKNLRSKYAFLFKHDDWIGAVTLVKRLWHLAYLADPKRGLRTNEFPVRSTRAIAAKSAELDDEENTDTAPGEKYFAVLAFDGDEIGKWLSGEFLASIEKLEAHHSAFSAALSNFALKEVRPIVQKPATSLEKYGGFLVYAGGDDVLALLPADRALECAQELRTAFRTATKDIIGENNKHPDASVGIAIAHFKAPIQDVVRAAQAAERRAKQKFSRSAVAVSLFRRSGEITEWGCRWDGGGLQLYNAISDALEARQLSGKFPYRTAELLQPYLTETSQLTKESHSLAAVEGFDQKIREIIRQDFGTVLSQQTPLKGGEKQTLVETIAPKLETYLQDLEGRVADALEKFETRFSAGQAEAWERPRTPDFICGSLIGLCQTVAFADRNRDDNNQESQAPDSESPKSADRHPAP
jgi:CRISPR-associated protein Cmr2